MHKSQNQIPFRIGLKFYMFSCSHVSSNLRYLRRDLGGIWAYCERPYYGVNPMHRKKVINERNYTTITLVPNKDNNKPM